MPSPELPALCRQFIHSHKQTQMDHPRGPSAWVEEPSRPRRDGETLAHCGEGESCHGCFQHPPNLAQTMLPLREERDSFTPKFPLVWRDQFISPHQVHEKVFKVTRKMLTALQPNPRYSPRTSSTRICVIRNTAFGQIAQVVRASSQYTRLWAQSPVKVQRINQ